MLIIMWHQRKLHDEKLERKEERNKKETLSEYDVKYIIIIL